MTEDIRLDMIQSEDRWIEETFKKIVCTGYVASQGDATQCNICGKKKDSHQLDSSTDAFGTVNFLDGSNAKYIRLAFNSKPANIFKLLIEHWKLGKPNFVISIRSDSKDNLKENQKLKSDLTQKFAVGANTPDLKGWILTTRSDNLDEASEPPRAPAGDRMINISIAPWGVVKGREDLIGINKSMGNSSNSLNSLYDCFLLVDDGTDRFGAEIKFRTDLENYMQSQDCYFSGFCLMVGCDTETITTIRNYVDNLPPAVVPTSNKVHEELLQWVKRRDLITFSCHMSSVTTKENAMLCASFPSGHLSATEVLKLAPLTLDWNRKMGGIIQEALLHIVTDSLVNNNADIVRLLLLKTDLDSLTQNVFKTTHLKKLAEPFIYSRSDMESTRKVLQKEVLALKGTNSVIYKLFDGSFKNSNENDNLHLPLSINDLFIWCVLTKRQTMAKLLWTSGKGALARALVASKLYRVMASEAIYDDLLEMEVDQLQMHAGEFDREALDLLEVSYREDAESPQRMLTCRMPNWSNYTCLELAFACNNKDLIAHPCAQLLLNNLWMGALRTRRHTFWKIPLCVILPFFLPCLLEFKSKKEINTLRLRKLMRHLRSSKSGAGAPSTDSDDEQPACVTKLIKFYQAPVTKFFSWSIFYVIFLSIFTCMMLTAFPLTVKWKECYVCTCIMTLALEKIRELWKTSWKVWRWNPWNWFDVVFVLEFCAGMGLRLWENTTDIGRVFYCCNIAYWYIRIVLFLRVTKELGPLLNMMSQMMKKLKYFVVLLLVVMMSYGVFRSSLLLSIKESNSNVFSDLLYQPYFMMHGELFTDEINPPCGNGTKTDGTSETECVTARWLNTLAMTLYLMAVCILLVNLLIAIFNSIFQRMDQISRKIWKFNLYAVVMEYEEKPTFPPPITIISYIVNFLRWLYIKFILSKLNLESTRLISIGGVKNYNEASRLASNESDISYDCEKNLIRKMNQERKEEKDEMIDERVRLMIDRLLRLSSERDSDGPEFANRLAILLTEVKNAIGTLNTESLQSVQNRPPNEVNVETFV